MIVVDAANVIGSRPTGWWRDRAGAAARFVAQVDAAVVAGVLDAPVIVVLEGAARAGTAAGTTGSGVDVVHAPGSGDDTIVAVVAHAVDADRSVRVVTADRGLRSRIRRTAVDVVGPSWLLDRLDRAGHHQPP